MQGLVSDPKAVASRGGRPAPAAADLVEEQSLLAVALFVAHSVVLGLFACEFAGAGPLDVAERAVQDGDAIEDSRGLGKGADLVEHCL